MTDAQFSALEKTIKRAASVKAACVIISGDLFDTRDPAPGLLSRAFDVLNTTTVPVFILPGNHDYLGIGSYYGKHDLELNPHIGFLANIAASPITLNGSDCRIYFRPLAANIGCLSPLEGLAVVDKEKLNIGVIHGSPQWLGLDVSDQFPIARQDIIDSGLDYIAAGHWHRPLTEKTSAGTIAWPGIPQPLSFGDFDQGTILQVELEKGRRPVLESIQMGGFRFETITAEINHPNDIQRVLEENAGPDKIVKTVFTFSDTYTEQHRTDDIFNSYTERYAYLMTESNREKKSRIAVAPPSGTVDHTRLLAVFEEEITYLEEADSEHRSHLYSQAREMGGKVIRGEV